MFYTFRQNNSGGSFINNAAVGQYVIIEAPTKERAYDIAEDIGLYWDGVYEGRDCDCCGDRWYRGADEYEEPKIYGEPFDSFVDHFDAGIHVYYLDGRHERIRGTREVRD